MQSLRALKTHWEYFALALAVLASRLVLLRVYDVELSQDGFDAVNLLRVWQTQGIGAVSMEGITRLVLHPLYTIVLYVLRILTPASIDFYFVARLFSTLAACAAVIMLFNFTRRAFGNIAAWCATLFLAIAPTFVWESIAILSSTLFLALYLAVLVALFQSRYRWAAGLAFLASITRAEGVVLIALVLLALLLRDVHDRKIRWNDWLVCLAFTLCVPLTILASSWLATGNALAFLGAQSISTIWLRFLAPGDFWKRAAFFVTQYPALIPAPMVWLGVAGIFIALVWHRARGTFLSLAVGALYLIFFETLVWLNYTTLETRFLMYPGLPLIVFAGIALADLRRLVVPVSKTFANIALAGIVVALCALSYQQGELGLRYIYNSQASMRQMADELAQIFPTHQRVNVLAYGGTSGALDFFARQHSLQLAFTEFRFAPDENPEQYIIDNKILFVIYPVGNAFAKAKYPYLAKFEEQTQRGVTFRPLVQFATSLDNQLYSIWSVSW